MSKLYVENKQVAVPGELLAEGMDYLPSNGAYRKDEQILANRVGLVSINGRAIKLIPLSGPYMPKRDDMVICHVTDIMMSGWRLDVNCANQAMLNMRDATNSFIQKGANLSRILQIGDYMVGKVVNVTSQKLIDITMKGPGLKKLGDGQIVKFSATKFPRMIGRSGSMVSMIKQATGCYIQVGQNGLIWLSGDVDKEVIAIEAINLIEENAHTSGLTDRVKVFLESKGLKVEERNREQDSQQDSQQESNQDFQQPDFQQENQDGEQ
ncbi:MAG: exosome complex component RRP4 [Candidatus Woesearchaeota archaeon]|jgi:exosome complex component RRP4